MRHLQSRIMLLPAVLLTAVALMCASSCSDNKQPSGKNIPENELFELDAAIRNADAYTRAARKPVDSALNAAMRPEVPPAMKAQLLASLTHELSVQSADTAISVANEAIRQAEISGNDSLLITARIARVSALTSSGVFNLAETEYEQLQNSRISDMQRIFLWQVGRQLYAYLANYTDGNFEISELFRKRSIAYDDSLMIHLDSDSHLSRFITAERMVTEGNYEGARMALDSLISNLKPNHNLYGMATYQMALVMKNIGNEREYGAYMAKSATSDIKTGVREGLALFNLANWLYKQGEVAIAFHYINFAMREAMLGDARMRAVNIASMLPMIDETYRENNKKSHDKLMIYTVVLLALLFIVGVIVAILVWQRQRREATQRKLKKLTRAQENHMANFVALCSTYYHKLNSLEMLVRRKIASGQTDELLKLLKSGRYSQDKSDQIFEIFDRSFIDIYPDFIEQINVLLRPEERYPSGDGKGLHNELRIYALVKMGITESTRIAQVLNYSVNTVYAYRNKMRNKAINRETFEEDVMALHPIDD